ERVVERYDAPRTDVAVFLPCSARKPYSESKSHSEFKSAIRGRAHEVVVTSPLGVVPRELELVYPAAHYDTPVTGRWDAKEREFVSGILADYLDKNGYDRLVAHVPEEGYGEIIESVAAARGLEVEFTVPEGVHPRDDTALEKLDVALEGETQANRSMEKKWYARSIADYQFGAGTFDDVLGLGSVDTEGRLPRIRVFSREHDEQIATVAPSYGYLALTLAGARIFDPLRVEDADTSIRVGDEVVFEGSSAVGVGRAKMYGDEMARSSRGISVDVRHVEEK
ncbi:MAG: DUF5591 domain-containing protein, partial [Halobacteria archaeon]|nr:DUF5591 domain-containing protein [Halobacteria archaeon]